MDLKSVPAYDGKKISGTWDLVAWILASAPFLAIPAAAIHSFQVEEGSVKRVRILQEFYISHLDKNSSHFNI